MTSEVTRKVTSGDAPGHVAINAGKALTKTVLLGIVALVFAVFLSVFLGAQRVDFAHALSADATNRDAALLFSVRLPRAVLGALAGGALGAVGASLQGLLRNPLAEPYILGTSGGAALFGTIAIAWFGAHAAWVPLASFSGALLATLLVAAIARASGRGGTVGMILAGVVVNTFAGAAITFVRLVARAENRESAFLWLVGSVGYETWATIGGVTLYVGIGVAALIAMSARLNLLAFGEESASYLGVDVRRLRIAVFVATSLVVGAVVSLVGPIGFVGLVVPHAVRLALGSDHRVVVLGSTLFGASFLCLADTAARLAFAGIGTELPVGTITAVIGCPVFLALLLRK